MFSNLLSYLVPNWQVKLCCWSYICIQIWELGNACLHSTCLCKNVAFWHWLSCAKHSVWACSPESKRLLFCAWKFRENFCSIAQEEDPEWAAPFSIRLFQFLFKWWEHFPPRRAVPALSTFGKSSLPGPLALSGTLNWLFAIQSRRHYCRARYFLLKHLLTCRQ